MSGKGMGGDTVNNVLRPLLEDRKLRDFEKLWEAARDWPPDAFAIAHVLLSHHAIYRCAVSTDEVDDFDDFDDDDATAWLWPNQRDFSDYVRSLAVHWREYVEAKCQGTKPKHSRVLSTFFERVAKEIPRLLACKRGYQSAARESLSTLFCLLATADETCLGLGLPGPPLGGTMAFNLEAEFLLVDPLHASLSRFSNHVIRVLPKNHTPQRGMTLRSLSHHLCATTHDFGVSWAIPARSLTTSRDERLNLLIVPWPYEVNHEAVRPAQSYDTELPDGWGYFDFAPPKPLDPSIVRDLVKAAIEQGRTVDGIILPEAAVTEEEAASLLSALDEVEVGLVLVGVRGERLNAARLYVDGFVFEQGKHHRWCLDRSQIEQYEFQRSLNPHVNWWENIRLAPRMLGFLAVSSWLTLCHVICEDLARLDPVDQLIRSVGPNLLVALLQDGPQLKQRWGARYATVYADDPGASVLTVSSLGMALASRPPKDVAPRRCVALWSDPYTGTKELDLAPEHEAIWISICSRRVTEFTADGRSDGGMGSQLVLVDHASVKR